MRPPWGLLTFEECECHPTPQWGPFKKHKIDYLQEMHLPVFGIVKTDLARPHKGVITFSLFVKAFGNLWMFTFGWSYAKRR